MWGKLMLVQKTLSVTSQNLKANKKKMCCEKVVKKIQFINTWLKKKVNCVFSVKIKCVCQPYTFYRNKNRKQTENFGKTVERTQK